MGASKRDFEFMRQSEDIFSPKKIQPKDIENFVNGLVKSVHEGNQNALNVFVSLKKINDLLETAKKSIIDLAIDSMSFTKETILDGHKITCVDGRVSFDYKGIDEIEEKEKELKELKEIYKQAYNGVQKGIVQLHESKWIDSDGVMRDLPKPVYGKSYLKIEK